MTLQVQLDHLFSLRREVTPDSVGPPAIRPQYMELLGRLGNPHLHLPPTIHVAGTNGKGSTIAFMSAMFEAAGYSAHVFTSPHLRRFNERIVIGGQEIPDTTLSALLAEVFEKSPGLDCGFFELTPAMAFAAFAREKADVLLLETGLGGRLDPTNVIPPPLASVITTLSYDHVPLLGRDIAEIAFEKAGIIKENALCIAGHQLYPDVLSVLEKQASHMGARLVDESSWPRIDNPPRPNLAGAHQLYNAGLAAATMLSQTHFRIDEDAIRQGMQNAHWPARLQQIHLPDLPEGWEFWLDGGHNDSAGMALADQAALWAGDDGKPLHIITGMQMHKDGAGFARALAPHVTSVMTILVPGHETGSIDAHRLAALWQENGAKGTVSALSTPWREALPPLFSGGAVGRILLTGSLYLADYLTDALAEGAP